MTKHHDQLVAPSVVGTTDLTGGEPADSTGPYVVVWNDPVDLKHLSKSIAICVTISLTTFLVARTVFEHLVDTKSLSGGYALLVGLVGCVTAAAICARLFAPKRTFSDEGEDRRAAAVAELEAMGSTPEAFSDLPATVRDEMHELGLAPAGFAPKEPRS